MSSSNTLRRFMAQPLVGFDWVRQMMANNPRTANTMMMMSMFATIFALGNGAEKMICGSGVTQQYEKLRKANRYFVPYWVADYSYRFPQIKQ